MEIKIEDLLSAKDEQLTRAHNEAALAAARSVHFQRECGRLQGELDAANAEIEKLKPKGD